MFSKPVLRLCDFLFVLRPLILTPAWSFYLLGAEQGRRLTEGPHPLFPSTSTFLSLTFILATAYLINQIFDRDSDRINKKIFFLSEGIFKVRTILVLAVMSFLFASFYFHQTEEAQKFPLILALVLSLIYSLPPLRLCCRPFADLLANAAGFGGVAFVLGTGLYGIPLKEASLASVPFVFLVGGTFLHTTILDMAGDRRTGKTTTSVLIGEAASKMLSVCFALLALMSSIAIGSDLGTWITAVSLPFFLATLSSKSRINSSLLVQIITLIINIAACLFWPVYLSIVAPLLLLSRYYYKNRFGISYPGVNKSFSRQE